MILILTRDFINKWVILYDSDVRNIIYKRNEKKYINLHEIHISMVARYENLPNKALYHKDVKRCQIKIVTNFCVRLR